MTGEVVGDARRAGPARRGVPLRGPGAGTVDVFTCACCGGKRRVLAYLTAPNAVRAILQHLALPTRLAQLAAAQGPPQQAWC